MRSQNSTMGQSGHSNKDSNSSRPANFNLDPKPSSNAPIGIFDSGVGGLTVLRELYRQLPLESVLYFGDTARLPYGTKSPSQIVQYVREILTWMTHKGVKIVIVACNTSSALAIEQVRSEFPDLPIVCLILPGARAAVQVGKRIGVIATPATAASNAYRQAILEVDPTAEVWQVGCPEFVPLIEQNRIDEPYTYHIAQTYLAPLLEQQIDTLIYGCTHYPHLAPVLKAILPRSIQLIDPAVHVIAAAAQELDLLGLKHTRPAMPTQFCVSGSPKPFVEISRQWLGCTPIVEQISLPEVTRQTMVKSEV
ncbi:glutamate racemase [Phormidesmis sp. 146-35]